MTNMAKSINIWLHYHQIYFLMLNFSSAGKKEAVFLGESKPNIEFSASKALKDATKMVTSFKEVKHGFKENILVTYFVYS